jgi:universal stress protein E
MSLALRRIVVIVDPLDRNRRAVGVANEIASRSGAQLTLVTFAYEYLQSLDGIAAAEAEKLRHGIIARQRKWLEKIAASLAVPAACEVVWHKDPAQWTAGSVTARGWDLVVKTGRRESHWAHTPLDWRFIRTCPVPFLLVASRPWAGNGVMAAVDLGSRVRDKRGLNLRVASMASDFATLLERSLHLAYAPPMSPVLRDLGFLEKDALTATGRARADKFARELASRGVGPWRVLVKAGPPAKVLASIAARHRIGLTVVGTVGRKGLIGRAIGNTVERVLELLRTDLLVVK